MGSLAYKINHFVQAIFFEISQKHWKIGREKENGQINSKSSVNIQGLKNKTKTIDEFLSIVLSRAFAQNLYL